MPIVDQFGGNKDSLIVATPNSVFLKRDISEHDIHNTYKGFVRYDAVLVASALRRSATIAISR